MAKHGPMNPDRPRQNGTSARPELPPAWVPANLRRVQLLRKRRTKAGLSTAEESELRQLQDLTRRYLDATAPISFDVIEDLKQAVEEAERRSVRSKTRAG